MSNTKKEWHVSEHYPIGLTGIHLQSMLNKLEDSNWIIHTLTYNNSGRVVTIVCYKFTEVNEDGI